MTYLLNEEIICSYCHLPSHADIWTVVNAKEDPELKDLLLGGELNMIECESCKKIFYADHFLLYHDPAEELMAFVYPYACALEKDKYIEKTKTDFEFSQATFDEKDKVTYQPLTLFGLDALVHVLERDEENSIQSEIVAVLAQQHGFPIKNIGPSEARLKNWPRVLPYRTEDDRQKNNLAPGLEMIEQLNPLLEIYKDARKALTP